jgi:hypothetical protein
MRMRPAHRPGTGGNLAARSTFQHGAAARASSCLCRCVRAGGCSCRSGSRSGGTRSGGTERPSSADSIPTLSSRSRPQRWRGHARVNHGADFAAGCHRALPFPARPEPTLEAPRHGRPRPRRERLIRDRRLAPHHALGLPAAQRHHDRRREAPVEGHRRPARLAPSEPIGVVYPNGVGRSPLCGAPLRTSGNHAQRNRRGKSMTSSVVDVGTKRA